MPVINTNIGSILASASANAAERSIETAMERLSSGKRLNTAADDAAGLSLSDRMTTNIRGLNMAVRNAVDAQALVNTSEGAQEEVTSILQRMRELAVQSSSDTNSTLDRLALQTEIAQLRSEIDRIASTTTWGGQNLLDGTFLNKTFQVGAVSGQTIQVTVENISKVTTYCPDIFEAALDRDGLDLSRAPASPDLGSSRIEPGRVSNYVGILADISETDLREQLDEYVAYVKRDNPC